VRGAPAPSLSPSRRARVSPEIDTEGFEVTGLAVPLNFTGTTITFQAAERGGGSFQNVCDATGAEVVLTVAAGRVVAIGGASTLAFLRHLKIRSGTAASPTVQGSNVRLLLIRKQGA
jgi:hypothetical protein